jgi:DNA invertase Pin-like site-specific DNA recombinase
MGRLMGYARVSTADQDLGLQLAALRHAGCGETQIFQDIASGARTVRPGLEACLHALRPGDTLLVWRLDRLGRSMAHLVAVIEELRGRQRKPLCPEDPRVQMASTLYADQRLTVPDICHTLHISQATFYRYVALGRRAADTT